MSELEDIIVEVDDRDESGHSGWVQVYFKEEVSWKKDDDGIKFEFTVTGTDVSKHYEDTLRAEVDEWLGEE